MARQPLITRAEYGLCRVVNHTWIRVELERNGREVSLTLRCNSCGADRIDAVDLVTGEVRRHYLYPEDYQNHYALEGRPRPLKTEYRREWFRMILEEETGKVVRFPAEKPKRKRRRRAS